MTYRDGITMTWQNGRELATFTNEDEGIEATFTYDPSGMRTKKQIANLSTTEYVYEDDLLLKMKYGTYLFTFSYDANGSPIGFKLSRTNSTTADTYYYYGLNRQGDVIALYNASGTRIASYSYDAYGKPLNTQILLAGHTTAININPLRYRGYVYDKETGLYYLQSRYYDPETCRFVNGDGYCSTGQGITGNNMFAYCENNPILYSDPSGNIKTYSGITYSGKTFSGVPTHRLADYGQIKDYWVDGNITPDVNYGFTYSNGLGVSINIGFISFAGQGGVSLDAKGNVGVQFSVSYSINCVSNGGDYGISIGSYNMFTNAFNIYKLEDYGSQFGIGGTAPIPHTKMNGFVESNLVLLSTIDPKKCYIGYSDFKGISTHGNADFNVHYTGGNTFDTKWDINIFELFGG